MAVKLPVTLYKPVLSSKYDCARRDKNKHIIVFFAMEIVAIICIRNLLYMYICIYVYVYIYIYI